MKDNTLPRGLVSYQDLSKKENKSLFSLRRMFWDYLTKLNVPFNDPCCTTASTSNQPVRLTEGLEYFDATSLTWTPVPGGSVTLPNAASFSTSVTTPATITNTIGADTGAYVATLNNVVSKRFTSAHDVTGTATALEIVKGVVTSTSAAAVTLTLDTVANIVTASGAARGTTINFIVDNGLGANTVTVAVGTGMTASSAITGGTTLTVASGVVGIFLLYIQSGTTAKISRIA